MKILRYYDTPFEAEVARGRLESEGVTAIVQNENLGSVIPIMGANQSFKPYLAVREEDLPLAGEILGMNMSKGKEVCQCPECGSEELDFRFFHKDKPMKTLAWLGLLPIFLASMHPGNIRRAYYCRKCENWF